jgi:hypothetical protein
MLHVLVQSLPRPRSDTHTKSIDPLALMSHDGRRISISLSLRLTGTCFHPVFTDRRGSPVLPSNEHYSLPISFCIPAISFFKQSPSLLDANCDSTCYNNLGDDSGCVCVCVQFVWLHSWPRTNGCWCSVCDLYAKQRRQSRVSKSSADKLLTGALLNYSRNCADSIDLRSRCASKFSAWFHRLWWQHGPQYRLDNWDIFGHPLCAATYFF